MKKFLRHSFAAVTATLALAATPSAAAVGTTMNVTTLPDGTNISIDENRTLLQIAPMECFQAQKYQLTGVCMDGGSPAEIVDGKIHSETGPAVVHHDGTKVWYRHGVIHRDGGPAIETGDGSKFWYKNGLQHREDGPAVENSDAYLKIFLGTAAKEQWYYEGRLHREGGPAMTMKDGTKSWFRHGVIHREDGPAVEHPDGRQEWWVNGKHQNPPAAKASLPKP